MRIFAEKNNKASKNILNYKKKEEKNNLTKKKNPEKK